MPSRKKEPFESQFADNFQPNRLEKFIQRHEVYRADVMKKMLPVKGKAILDLACGDGDFLFSVSDQFQKLIGFDISETRIKNARKKLRGVNKKNSVVLKRVDIDRGLPLKTNTVDVVICEASLSYFVGVENVLTEIKRVLKKNGSFILQIGNYAFLPRRLALLTGRLPKVSSFSGFGDGGMLHYFTYDSLASLLEKHGFEIETQENSGVLASLRKIWPALLAGDIIYKVKKRHA